ncbi:hypothetical protein WISP_102191 [Willisornis vidua]|uniref:Uncharacterized protein n=1 Tax=Willisornis vidua TaxID=1566151 RepID=A0ABQ9CYC4_9PASS|nr:hypothetical protein WISP_102191 [Willisornis vidua]
MPIAHLLELWKGIEVEPMETESVVEDAAPDEEPVKEVQLTAKFLVMSSENNESMCNTVQSTLKLQHSEASL